MQLLPCYCMYRFENQLSFLVYRSTVFIVGSVDSGHVKGVIFDTFTVIYMQFCAVLARSAP